MIGNIIVSPLIPGIGLTSKYDQLHIFSIDDKIFVEIIFFNVFNQVNVMTANIDKRKMLDLEVSKVMAVIILSQYHSSSFPNNSLTVT